MRQIFEILSFVKMVGTGGQALGSLQIICVWVADGAIPAFLGLLIFQYSHDTVTNLTAYLECGHRKEIGMGWKGRESGATSGNNLVDSGNY